MVHLNKLTQMQAKNLGAGKHSDGQGLWLVKRKRETGRWVLRVVIAKKRREMGLGRWPDVSIAEARERAAFARKQVRDDLDPIAERLKKRASQDKLSLQTAIEDCFQARKAELKNDGMAGRWLSPLTTHIIPKIGHYPVEDIDQHILKTTLEPIWHNKPDSAKKALGRVSLTLKHAAALGIEVDLQATMKARALLGKQRHSVTHIPSLPYKETPAFFSMLSERPDVVSAALRFLILTVARTGEVRLARLDEITNGLWVIPSERTKTGIEHRIPLSSVAQRIVDDHQAHTESDLLFASKHGKPISDMAMSALMKRKGIAERPHGFRATFRTWVEEQTDTPFEVAETALGHSVGNKVVRAYQRSDHLVKRTELMEVWAKFITGS